MIVIIDEFSMIKADMLYQLDMRLREVKEKPDLDFGGVAVFMFGDILQLRPVKAKISNLVITILFLNAAADDDNMSTESLSFHEQLMAAKFEGYAICIKSIFKVLLL